MVTVNGPEVYLSALASSSLCSLCFLVIMAWAAVFCQAILPHALPPCHLRALRLLGHELVSETM